MKSTKLVVIGMAAVFSLSLGIRSTRAQDFNAFVNAVVISSNSSGGLVYHKFRNGDIIRACANEQGITNLMGLSLVYNRTADELQVVTGTNHTVVCTPLTFAGGTWLSNSNHTKAERLAFVYVETNNVTGGTLSATERFKYGPSNELTFFSLSGQLQYTVPASGTNPAAIYRGRIVAGTRGDEDMDEDHEH
ncbi:MAG TPA: hypothetical protein VNZ64_00040 [Candidatus Acidoferrum sp.]|jgi:hypothetical protein|nr:hypothetical protein [Candidatus Acidoferrum sp.]